MLQAGTGIKNQKVNILVHGGYRLNLFGLISYFLTNLNFPEEEITEEILNSQDFYGYYDEDDHDEWKKIDIYCFSRKEAIDIKEKLEHGEKIFWSRHRYMEGTKKRIIFTK